MQYGLVFPSADIARVPELAARAEAAGWDGVFVPDCISIDPRFNDGVPFETHDPWIVLAAIATRTRRVRLGTMLTPPARRRPWKLARETVTLDHLSGGRLILPVGLGALDDQGFGAVGEATDRTTRAQLLDESLAILDGLWSGEPFGFTGRHYRFDELTFRPRPLQRPRIPIWVVGLWPVAASLRRAARWDGLLPNKRTASGEIAAITPDDIRAMRDWFAAHRDTATLFDIIHEGHTPADNYQAALAAVRPYAEAGATWWLEAFWHAPHDWDAIAERVGAGSPRE